MEAALKILDGGKFRYSSPATFNDPFDLQTELYFEFDITDFPDLFTEAVDALVRGWSSVSPQRESLFGKVILLLREQHEKGRYRSEHLDFMVKPLMPDLARVLEDTRRKYNDYWRDPLRTIKIFSVSEHNKSILMWSHYAEYHKGVCFKLKVMPEQDNPICAAKKVNYLSKPPSFFSFEEWINSLVSGNDSAFFERLYHQYPLAKSDVWNYEKEWRVWAPFEENHSAYIDIPIVDGEIDAIYFGIEANPELVQRLIGVAKAKNIKRFFRAEKKINEYGLIYNAI